MKKYRIPVPEWRREFFNSRKGIPTIKEINDSIDRGEIPGTLIAGKYIVYCDSEYEPLWNETIPCKQDSSPPAPVSINNSIAERILAANS